MEKSVSRPVSLVISAFFGVFLACNSVLGPLIADSTRLEGMLIAILIAIVMYSFVGFISGFISPENARISALIVSLPAILIVGLQLISTGGGPQLLLLLLYLVMPFGSAMLGALIGARVATARRRRGAE